MGIEQLISSDRKIHIVNWGSESILEDYSYTEEQRIIIEDAIDCGITGHIPPEPQGGRLFSVVTKDKDGVIIVSINKEPDESDGNNPEAIPIIYPNSVLRTDLNIFQIPDAETEARLFHLLIMTPGNPLELHWRQRGMAAPVINIERVEEIKKVSDYTAHAKQMGPLLKKMGDLFESGRGRRKGSVEPSAADFEKMKRMTIALRKGKHHYSWEYIADKLGVDLKTLTKYREKWGIK